MSARDTIAATLCRVRPSERIESREYDTVLVRDHSPVVSAIIEDLTAAGYTIVGPADMEKAVEIGLRAAEDAAARMTFGDDGVRDGFTFQRSFTEEFKARFREIHRAALTSALTAAAPHMPVPDGWRDILIDDETLTYVLRYGGRCRDCADHFGTCASRGLPCNIDEAKTAIRHVLRAVNYGMSHGCLPIPAAPKGEA